MILPLLILCPLVAGLLLMAGGGTTRRISERSCRVVLGLAGGGAVLAVLGLATSAAMTQPAWSLQWGAGLTPQLRVTPMVSLAALMVPAIAAPVVVWAAAHEASEGLARLVGGLVAFVGAMELLVLADDLLTLAIGWELVGGLSWVLLAHRWRDDEAVSSAGYAFNTVRFGGLGLFVAAGAALASAGSFAFGSLASVASGPYGPMLASGVLVAVLSKSAQVPFSPWLFRAMAGPSSVSALLHSSTMVAAGAWLVVRLHEPLSLVPWFGPVLLGVGLGTACAGGVVASFQPHAKRLLAASTSAHFGLIFAAVGAGAANAGMAHLVAHAAFKSLLFLAAGTALGAVGTAELSRMGLGKQLPWVAAASAVGVLSLAGVPPLGAAWSKERIVAAVGEVHPGLAVGAIAAGGLSAWYAVRFQLLAFGRRRDREGSVHPPDLATRAAPWGLAALVILSSAVWVPRFSRSVGRWMGQAFAEGETWELVLSVGTVLLAAGAAALAYRRVPSSPAVEPARLRACIAAWLGLPTVIDRAVVAPTVASATACARFDDRVVDGGVRLAATVGRRLSRLGARVIEHGVDGAVGVVAHVALLGGDATRRSDDRGIDRGIDGLAAGLGAAGRASRRVQSGALPVYYVLVVVGLLGLIGILALGR
ncbi:MAG: NADH-quinone oxidoreductase subunit L [Myxococcota bacterium]